MPGMDFVLENTGNAVAHVISHFQSHWEPVNVKGNVTAHWRSHCAAAMPLRLTRARWPAGVQPPRPAQTCGWRLRAPLPLAPSEGLGHAYGSAPAGGSPRDHGFQPLTYSGRRKPNPKGSPLATPSGAVCQVGR